MKTIQWGDLRQENSDKQILNHHLCLELVEQHSKTMEHFFLFFFIFCSFFFSISLRAIFGQQSINTSTGFSVYFSSLDLWKQVML